MADVQVTCIDKPDPQSPHVAIASKARAGRVSECVWSPTAFPRKPARRRPDTRRFLVQEVMGGGMLGVDAGSTICGYEIAGIGHGVHMRLVTYPDPACIILGWVWVVCCLSGYPRKNV
jgi:hypothetical protein